MISRRVPVGRPIDAGIRKRPQVTHLKNEIDGSAGLALPPAQDGVEQGEMPVDISNHCDAHDQRSCKLPTNLLLVELNRHSPAEGSRGCSFATGGQLQRISPNGTLTGLCPGRPGSFRL
ncbi:MAG TPA: hypothetical protein VJK71_03350 [Gemmatimonadales bacterium]|nr:hypothetical protein [Gemmatimonadales bacterium]